MPLGKMHPSKPPDAESKVMSKRHKDVRKKFDKMEKTKGKNNKDVLKARIKYNEKHAQEHIKDKEKAKKQLNKIAEKQLFG
jgi:hypothetical protein